MAVNPFVVGGDSADPTAGLPDANSFADIQNQWNDFLAKPGGQAALMQFAVNLAQPPSFGDTALSRAARAVGGAGEAQGRVEAQDIAQQEAQSKEALRSATGELQTEKIKHLGEATAAAQESAQQKMSLGKLRAKLTIMGLHEKEKKDIATRNQQHSLMGEPLEPVPSLSEFTVNDPTAASIAAEAGIDVSLAKSAAGTKAPTTTAPPDAPPNPADRKPNTTYNTPKGPLKWTGTGWINP